MVISNMIKLLNKLFKDKILIEVRGKSFEFIITRSLNQMFKEYYGPILIELLQDGSFYDKLTK